MGLYISAVPRSMMTAKPAASALLIIVPRLPGSCKCSSITYASASVSIPPRLRMRTCAMMPCGDFVSLIDANISSRTRYASCSSMRLRSSCDAPSQKVSPTNILAISASGVSSNIFTPSTMNSPRVRRSEVFLISAAASFIFLLEVDVILSILFISPRCPVPACRPCFFAPRKSMIGLRDQINRAQPADFLSIGCAPHFIFSVLPYLFCTALSRFISIYSPAPPPLRSFSSCAASSQPLLPSRPHALRSCTQPHLPCLATSLPLPAPRPYQLSAS